MKKAISLLLALALCLSLCACGGKRGSEKNLSIPAKTLAAASLQSAGCAAMDKLVDGSDEDFAKRFLYYYGIDFSMVKDCALASCSATSADELSILQAAEGTDMDELISALNDRCVMQTASYALYSPEDVAKLEAAEVFTVGDCAVLIVSNDAAAIKTALLALFDDPSNADALAQQYIDSIEAVPVDTYDYSTPVEENTAKDESWFSDAVFVGDSRMVGLVSFAQIPCAANFSRESINIADMFTKECIETAGGNKTIADALEGGSYGKCYIMTGVNEMGWLNLDTYINYYTDFVEHIKEIHPETQIYVISILPVGPQAAENQEYFNNDRVNEMNAMLLQMCSDTGVYYLNAFESVAVNGALPEEAAPDGIHMGNPYCSTVKQYLLTHTVDPAA